MKLHWNYWLHSFLVVATKRRSEMTSYLNNGYDVMNYFAKVEKFSSRIIINNAKFFDCQLDRGLPPPPPPYKLIPHMNIWTLSFSCHNFMEDNMIKNICRFYKSTSRVLSLKIVNFSKSNFVINPLQTLGLRGVWGKATHISLCSMNPCREKLISWFCTLDVSSEIPTPGWEMSTTIYRYSLFHNHSWPWSEFVHMTPDILPWSLGLIYWTPMSHKGQYPLTSQQPGETNQKIKIFT